MPKGIYERKKGTYPKGQPYHMAKRKGLTGHSISPHGRKGSSEKQKAAVDALLAAPTTDMAKMGDVIESVGYSRGDKGGSNVPQVVGSKGFIEYLNERVPDADLAQLISSGMGAEKAPARYEDFTPDWGNRFKFVELVTKLKGYNITQPPTVQVQFTNAIPRPSIDVDSVPEADVS
jgi:hypothetical protein